MSAAVTVTFEMPLTSAWGAVLFGHFKELCNQLANVKALSGLDRIEVVAAYEPQHPRSQVLDDMVYHVSVLNTKEPRKSLGLYATRFPIGGAIPFGDNYLVPKLVKVELSFKDPNKAMLFKLARP